MRLEKLLGPAAFISSIGFLEYGYKIHNNHSIIASAVLFTTGIGIEAYNNLDGKRHMKNLYESTCSHLKGFLLRKDFYKKN